jgi:hypothetical protein
MWSLYVLLILFEIGLCIRVYLFLGSMFRKVGYWFTNLPEAKDGGSGNHQK